jgi:DNA-binding transcriptional LysR family regulator
MQNLLAIPEPLWINLPVNVSLRTVECKRKSVKTNFQSVKTERYHQAMELRNVRSLVHLAQTGSITRAAADLDITPAAVHKQLRALEKELGVKLYRKAGGVLRLTEQGTLLLPDLRRLLDDERLVLERAEESKQLRSGTVRIGSGVSMSACLLPPLLRRFRRRYPGIDVYVEAGNIPALLASLRRGALDAIFITEDVLGRSRAELMFEAHWKYELVFLAPRRMAPRRCALASLAKQPFILFGSGFRLVEKYFEDLGFNPRVTMRFDHADAMRAMSEAGLGIALVPFWSVPRPGSAATWILEQKEPPLYTHLGLARLKTTQVQRAVQSFLDMARDCGFPQARMMR